MSITDLEARAATEALHLDYLTREHLASRPAPWWRNVLGVVGFGRTPTGGGAVPTATTCTPMLDAPEVCEVWRVGDAPGDELRLSAQVGRVSYRCSDALLFGSLSIDEREFDGLAGAAALLHAAETAYEEVFAALEATQFRHLIRIWNYLPAINAAAGGEERYRLFNTARQSAFRKSGRAIIGSVPAACALGSPADSPLCIYFLAARHPSMTIENPRQTSAYHYPLKFGKHSPIFSRACIFNGARAANLFVSGTASIVGCETLHHGNAEAQTRETLLNINALLDEANRISGAERYALAALKLKVYVRHAADLSAIKAGFSREQVSDILFLQADVCRDDLLVEIEATGEARVA